MLRILTYVLAMLGLATLSCTPTLQERLATTDDWTIAPPLVEQHDCRLASNHIPDTTHLDFWPIKYVRLNHHVFDRTVNPLSFDSIKGPGQIAGIVDVSNVWLAQAPRPRLPVDDPPPRLPNRMRFVTSPDPASPGDDGVYFHYDTEVPWHVHTGRNQNRGDKTSYNDYRYRADSVLNVMYLSHHPDSLASKRYRNSVSGVALNSTWIKLAGEWHTFVNPWPHHANLMHEVGHIYSLNHSWIKNDGCEDTPPHPNCWSVNAKPGCPVVSNNMMDYSPDAITLTPCQIGKIQEVMSREGTRQRKYLVPNWCKGSEGVSATLQDTFRLLHRADLESDLELLPGAYLQVRCRLSMPEDAKIIVHPGATLDLASGSIHNSCDLNWGGIVVKQLGRRRGKLIWREGSQLSNTTQVTEPLAGA